MSAGVAPTAEIQTVDDTDQRLDLHARFLQAAFVDTTLLQDIPKDVMLVLLPDDDPAFVERETTRAARAAQRGQNVYLRQLRVADLPELPSEPSGPPVGMRRTRFNRDGSIAEQEICGPDGDWHNVDPPEPVDE